MIVGDEYSLWTGEGDVMIVGDEYSLWTGEERSRLVGVFVKSSLSLPSSKHGKGFVKVPDRSIVIVRRSHVNKVDIVTLTSAGLVDIYEGDLYFPCRKVT
jgi:hypothetical protein